MFTFINSQRLPAVQCQLAADWIGLSDVAFWSQNCSWSRDSLVASTGCPPSEIHSLCQRPLGGTLLKKTKQKKKAKIMQRPTLGSTISPGPNLIAIA